MPISQDDTDTESAAAVSLASIDTKLTSTNTKLDTLHADVDGLETLVTSTNTKLDTGNTTAATTDAKFPSAATPADGEAIGSLSKIRSLLTLVRAGSTTLTDLAKGGVTGAITAANLAIGYLNVLPVGKFNATKYSLLDGQGSEIQITARGALLVVQDEIAKFQDDTVEIAATLPKAVAVATHAWTGYQSSTTKIGTAGINIKTSAGRLRRIGGQNSHATNQYWLVVVDKASAPIANDAVVASIFLPPTTSRVDNGNFLDFGDCAKYLGTGVSFAISTTPEKVTLAGTSDCHVWADYL